MILGIEHTAIASPDPEALGRWYADVLGFTINYHSPSSKTMFVRAPNGSMLEIVSAKGERGAPEMRTPGLRHLALAVDEFAPVYEKLKAAGVNFLGEPETSKGNTVVFFTDPDGNLLHLLQRERPLPESL
ncbi:MAG TPA: VOC family protein [Bryobacteraceae bacterium]|nr:VOC family protein [Bryobacteraceae bacterium]